MKRLATIIALSMSALTANSQILINEFCTGTDTIEYKGYSCDWVELYNAGLETVNLKGFGISDNPKKPRKHVIDCDAWIAPGGYKVVLCNGMGVGLNASFKLSSDGGESVVLSDASGKIVDQIATPRLYDDYSYGRISDGADGLGVFDKATPGASNGTGNALSEMPVISPSAGFYSGKQTVTITCGDPSATVHYTTDGSMPTSKSKVYSGSLAVDKNTVVRAIAIGSGRKASGAATATYFVNSRYISLPVVSLSTDRDNFYSNTKGIYVAGTNGIAGNCQDQPKNWNQDWEYPVHFEYFDKQHNLQVSQDAGVKITGSCSRGNAMKSLKITARREYGDNRLRYKFFDKKDIAEFKAIVLRNSGNDFGFTMYRDGLITGIAGEGMDVDVQGFQPAAVFLNGEYLGLHNIREKVSTHFVEENYGVDDDMVDLLENNAQIIDGDNKDYNQLIEFVKSNSLAVQSNYDKVAAQMDIDNFIDYWIAQIYVDNEDWPNNNIKYWRARGTNTKWRWILFGAEFSCNVYGGQPDVNSVWRDIDEKSNGWGTTTWSNQLMRSLLKNDGFRAKFVQRFAFHIDHTFRYERVKEFSDSLKSLIANEWNYHAERWWDWWYWGWDNRCQDMNNWFKNRPANVVGHLQSYFNLGPQYDVTVTSDCPTAKFSINGCPSTANVSGRYFSGVTLGLGAVLPQDKAVDYWRVVSSDGVERRYDTESIDLDISSGVVIKLYTKDAVPVEYPERAVSATGLYVNEVMPRNCGALSDETGHFPAWIEFYNDNTYSIDMAGLYIMNEQSEYQIPGGHSDLTTIPPKGRIVFFADAKPDLGPLHLPFKLDADKDNAVYLGEIVGGKANYIDWYETPTLKKNQSYGRAADGAEALVIFTSSTAYAPNGTGVAATELPIYTPVAEVYADEKAAVNVFPNPTSDYVTIDCGSAFVKYTLYTISGRKVMGGVGREVDLTGLPSGLYVLQVHDGGLLQSVKVIRL